MLNEGHPKKPHLNLITCLKALYKYSHTLRFWGMGHQHMNFEGGQISLEQVPKFRLRI